MRIVGLITEYNPFHNGHQHHLRESLRVTEAEASVAIMSGHFLQRGEPALVDKWVRTEMALSAGVDLVLELPFPFACNSAPYFAMGAVQSLNALGVVDALCFGSESGELELLDEIAEVLVKHQVDIEGETVAQLRQGVNYPVARSQALKAYLPHLDPEELASPNNILGIEYLRALRQTNSEITPYTIRRLGAGYHDTEVVGEIASATGIRRMLTEAKDVETLLPAECWSLLRNSRREGQCLDAEKLFAFLSAALMQEPETLQNIYQVDNGLDLRLAQAAMTAENYSGLAQLVKSKQWTLTRVQRILSYVLLKARKDEMQEFADAGPRYLRLLGCSEKGQKVLARARKLRSLPIIDDPARAGNNLRRFYSDNPDQARLAERMLAYDLRATRLYGLLLKKPLPGHRNRDFFMSPTIYSDS
jgi:predicted nucleotidyltransferase